MMQRNNKKKRNLKNDLQSEIRAIQIFSTSVIFSAAAVASSTVLLFIPNLETLSLFMFLVGYRYGVLTGVTTVFTSVVIFEMFASQIYGTGGVFPFLLKFPPFLLIMFGGVYFRSLKNQKNISTLFDGNNSSETLSHEKENRQILFLPQKEDESLENSSFNTYERLLLMQFGFSLTIIYDLVTSLGILVYVPTFEAFFISFIIGIPFILFHQITNAILFSTIPSILTALNKARVIG